MTTTSETGTSPPLSGGKSEKVLVTSSCVTASRNGMKGLSCCFLTGSKILPSKRFPKKSSSWMGSVSSSVSTISAVASHSVSDSPYQSPFTDDSKKTVSDELYAEVYKSAKVRKAFSEPRRGKPAENVEIGDLSD